MITDLWFCWQGSSVHGGDTPIDRISTPRSVQLLYEVHHFPKRKQSHSSTLSCISRSLLWNWDDHIACARVFWVVFNLMFMSLPTCCRSSRCGAGVWTSSGLRWWIWNWLSWDSNLWSTSILVQMRGEEQNHKPQRAKCFTLWLLLPKSHTLV